MLKTPVLPDAKLGFLDGLRYTHRGVSLFSSARRFEQFHSTPQRGVDRRRLDGGGSILTTWWSDRETPWGVFAFHNS